MRKLTSIFFLILLTRLFAFSPDSIRTICESSLGGRDGAVLLADAHSGEILAAVGSPDILSGERFFPPGSVFKIVSALAALEMGISPAEKVRCTYWYNAPGGRMHCSWYPGHGIVDIRRALAVSCSFYFYHLVDEGVSPDKIRYIASLLGFDESPAKNIPPVRWQKLNTLNAPYMFAIGLRGIEVSPYHILRMMLAVANRGFSKSDYSSIYDGVENISRDSWDVVCDGLRMATTEGIVKSAAPNGIPAAGKTGTAPLLDNPDVTCGWFAGYIPYDSPDYVLVVLVADGSGFSDAAPIAGRIFLKIYRQDLSEPHIKNANFDEIWKQTSD